MDKDLLSAALRVAELTLFVVEARGKLAPMAETLTSYHITRQAKVISERRDVTPSAALRQASEQFCEPLSCHLLTAGWLGLAHCARGLEAAACQTRRLAQPADSQAVTAPVLVDVVCSAAREVKIRYFRFRQDTKRRLSFDT